MSSLLFAPVSLGSIALRTLLLLIVTTVVAGLFRRRSAAMLHGIWTVGLGACLVTPVVMWLSPAWSLPLLPPAKGHVVPLPRATDMVPLVAVSDKGAPSPKAHPPLLPVDLPTTLQANTPATTAAAPSLAWPSLGTAAFWGWAVGLVVILARLLRQLLVAQCMVREASELAMGEWCRQRDLAAQLLGVSANVTLKRHSASISPLVIGLAKPILLLPADADTWSPEKRHLVLLHELAHIGRHDVMTHMLASVACALYWFNPLAWWGRSQMKHLREIACDDAVVIHSGLPATYAETLLDVARQYRCRPLPSAVAMARSPQVEGRIMAILSATRSRASLTRRSVRVLAAAAIVVAVCVGTCQLSSWAVEAEAATPAAETTGVGSSEAETKQAASDSESDLREMRIHILDDDGQPLEGAKLFIGVWYAKGYQGEEVPKEYFADSRGIVNLKLPKRLLILRMWPSKPGYVPLFVNFGEGTHREGQLIPDEYKFHLSKGHPLSGRIVDEEGHPIANAQVNVQIIVNEPGWGTHPEPMISNWLTDSDFNRSAPVTDSDGRWSIDNAPAPPKGTGKDYEFRLRITHPDFAGDGQWGEIQERQGITTQALRDGSATIRLDGGIAISGTVTDTQGAPVTKGWVVWNDDPYNGQGVWESEIDSEGHFRTNRLAAGEYPIIIVAPGFAAQRRMVAAEPGMEELNFKLQPGKRIEIHFVDREGKPIPKAGVSLANSSDQDTWNNSNALHNHHHPNVPDYGIPRQADDHGVYVWDWAPDGAVSYYVGAVGFSAQYLTLVPKSEPHIVTLAPQRVVVGTVTDATTGAPIKSFEAIPVIVFQPDFFSTWNHGAKVGREGHYELPLTGSGNLDALYRVRFEAEGYRSVVSEESFGPLDGRVTLDISLEPATARKGRVLDAQGAPVENATVVVSSPTDATSILNAEPRAYSSGPFRSDAAGNFQLSATSEPTRVRVYDDRGFAEKAVAADDDAIGELKLQPWAKLSGRLMQGDQPIAGQGVNFVPMPHRDLTEARFQDSFYTQTDPDGRFEFDRLPPTSGFVGAYLGPWEESPLTSRKSLPLELKPGEHREIALGGDGTTITGRVVATGRSNDEFSKQWSLNYLVSRSQGIEYPAVVRPLSFDPSGPVQAAWLKQPDFQWWITTRLNYFVKLAKDGRLSIYGVEPGEYDLVIQLYEEPAGCLVETVGERVVPVTVTGDQAAGQLDLDEIEVPCRIGPRVGSDMRAFKFTDASGQVRSVDDMKGRFVLLHVWATWCEPCMKSMPLLQTAVEDYADKPLTAVGLNIDQDQATAKSMAESQKWNWTQNYLGPDSDLARQLAVSSAPAYYLIGPDGKLVGSANVWEPIEQLLRDKLE